jgi:hypothetical protein
MSIVVMRRKVRENHPRVAPISGHLGEFGKTGAVVGGNGSKTGFSINGGIRNLRGVGVIRMVGSGGWSGGGSGVQRLAHGNSSWYFSLNDPTVIKKSSKGNSAMIDMKYRWIKGGQYPRSWYKDINSASLVVRSQSDYIKKRVQSVMRCATTKTIAPPNPCANVVCSHYVGNDGLKKRVRWKPITKTAPNNAMSQSDYIEKGRVQKRECLSLKEPNKFTHFPLYFRHKSLFVCDVNYLTWQEAVAAKLLPDDYVGSGR